MADNVETLRAAYAAWNRGDHESFFEIVDPDVEWIPAAQFVGGPVHGIEELRRLVDTLTDAFEEIHWNPVRIEEGSEEGQVVAVLDTTTRGKGSGAEVTIRVAHLLRLRDGKVVWGKVYPHAPDAFEAAGLEALE